MTMYLEHFGLRETPFSITPHTDFFFSGANRGSTLDALIYAITHDEGIVKVTGEVGSGKTMLCRMLLTKLPDNIATVFLANPSLSRDEILYALADELGMPEPPQRVHLLLRALQALLVDIFSSGKQVVVLIDEAHAMPPESLEEVRLLSNLESNRHKLLKIVMFGQPELDEILSRNEMRQLRERVTHNFGLEPLTQTDIGSYLMFRMRAAGYDGPDLFTTGAVRLIAEASLGLSRRINIAADKALLAAFVDGEHQIDVKQAKAAIRDAAFGSLPGSPSRFRRYMPWIATALSGAAGLAALGLWLGAVPALTPATQIPQAHATAAPGARAPTASVSAPTQSPEGSPTPGAAESSAAGTTALAAASTAGAAAEAPLPLQPSVELSDRTDRADSTSGPTLTTTYSAAFDAWIASAPNRNYFIQLLRTNTPKPDDVERYLAETAPLIDAAQIRVYRTHVAGQDWLGVVYGEFPSREAALAALDSLPQTLREAGAYPRRVAMLR